MKYAPYVVPALITLTISVGVGYYFYNKYKPIIDAANTADNAISGVEGAISSVENWGIGIWNDIWGTPSQGGML